MKTIVRVYYNRPKQCYSIQTKIDGHWIVTDYTNQLCLKNVRFRVSEKGRQRVLREKRRNVHAYIQGEVIKKFPKTVKLKHRLINYNPYKFHSFYIADFNRESVYSAKYCFISGKNILI